VEQLRRIGEVIVFSHFSRLNALSAEGKGIGPGNARPGKRLAGRGPQATLEGGKRSRAYSHFRLKKGPVNQRGSLTRTPAKKNRPTELTG
jgi:hypothetical protein